MNLFKSRFARVAALATLGLLCLQLSSDAPPMARASLSARMRLLPPTTLWAWERPEDLRDLDARNTAIAFLDQTILLTPQVAGEARRQPLSYPTGARRIAVVRIEAGPGARLNQDQQQQVIRLLLHTANQPGIAALQVDFDATRSQREFYAGLLTELRQQMPSGLPLSITALASWCSYDDWIGGLPIDEAVPMLFRMEPDRRRVAADAPWLRVREPLCAGSVGISTHEAWPADLAGKRIYVFADRGWREDLALLGERRLP
jgi:hypothetical protein